MQNWISSKKRRGLFKGEIRFKIPWELRKLVEKRAEEKGMLLSEYMRYLIHQDLEKAMKEGAYGERTNP